MAKNAEAICMYTKHIAPYIAIAIHTPAYVYTHS